MASYATLKRLGGTGDEAKLRTRPCMNTNCNRKL